jgi:sulfite exporter TauE/SafE
MIAMVAGIIAGAAHVVTGPDHLTAIAPLAMREKKHAWRAGLRWGIGHSTGLCIVAILALLLRETLPVELLSSWGERLVGAVLICIGLWALRHAFARNVHAHEHRHDGDIHVHLHTHAPKVEHEEPVAHQHTHAPVLIGALHGLAGSSHFLGILPMLALPTKTQAVTYLLAFAAGSIVTMAAFSCGMGLLGKHYAARGVRIYRGLTTACAISALIIGGVWISGGAW